MSGTSKATGMPAPRGLVRAARENLSEFEQRVRRRPGLGGAAACLVVPIVVMNFLVNGPENVWCRGVAVVGLLIVITWGHAGFQRTCGGLKSARSKARRCSSPLTRFQRAVPSPTRWRSRRGYPATKLTSRRSGVPVTGLTDPVGEADGVRSFAPRKEEPPTHHGGYGLPTDGAHGGAAHPEVETEDQQRVEDDLHHDGADPHPSGEPDPASARTRLENPV
ncbi:hypothetical protein [Streptomyces canus]|uniref:hypothetical protein n=1 Tax=Streptomyces canus TaxID=58343 RepID=UPI002DD8C336|nr:hypothetical protein [Streptomyces canus]WSD83230.1 hypothetical protein OG925_02370 [Streptomyces canus]